MSVVELVIAILRPPYVVLGAVVKGVYRLFFAWWLDKRLVRSSNRKFSEEVKRYLNFLFVEYGARTVPNDIEPPPLFDFAMVTLSVQDMLFRLQRGRGNITLNIASSRHPDEWHELSTLLSTLDVGVDRRGFGHLLELEHILRPHMKDLIRAFSPDCYAETKNHLAEVYEHDRVTTQQWQTELNRKLYS